MTDNDKTQQNSQPTSDTSKAQTSAGEAAKGTAKAADQGNAKPAAAPSAEQVAKAMDKAAAEEASTASAAPESNATMRETQPKVSSNEASAEKASAEKTSPAATTAEPAATAPVTAAPAANNKPSKSGRGLALLALLLALLALAAAAYLGWMGNNEVNAAKTEAAIDEAERARLQDSINNLQRENGNLKQDLRAQGQGRDALMREVQASTGRQDLIDASLNQLRAQLGGSRRAWLEAEVAYLLRFAHERLQLNGDFVTAQRALQAADDRILEMGDPGLFPVRAKISQASANLQSVKQPDVSGMSLRLNTWLGELPSLALRDVAAHPESYSRPEAEATEQAADVAQWRQGLSDVWAEMKTLVQVRSDETPYEVMPKIEDEFFIRQNLRLQLESARIALLQRDTAVFQASAATADNWLNRYFAVTEPAVAGLSKLLQSWQSVDLDPPRPDVSAAFNAMRQIMDQRDDQRRNLVPAGSNNTNGGAE